ncbi:hypothetical protein [Solirubrobacter soli]|uniref:hypothetical protein n=1 Tax=Solirubrobacter soli TaxID=363832 RepID=UPI0012FAF730|nr:hypothetical protein [Solirubrobacter soli]
MAHHIAKSAGVPFHLTATATLIACSEASVFLEACRTERVKILGTEGFDLVGDGRRPDMEAILDLSSIEDANRSVDEAQAFVAEVCRDGLMFEFQLASS